MVNSISNVRLTDVEFASRPDFDKGDSRFDSTVACV